MNIKKCLTSITCLIAIFGFSNAQSQTKPGDAMRKAARERNAQNAQKEREQKQNSSNSSQTNNSGGSSSSSENQTNHGIFTNVAAYVKGQFYPSGWNNFADGDVFVDIDGQLITPFYKNIIRYKGVTITSDYDENFKVKYGVVDSLGRIIANPIYNYIHDLPGDDQFLRSEIKENGFDKYGLISKTGKVLIDPIYGGILYGNANLFIVISFPERKYGLIDKLGKAVIAPIYNFISSSSAICMNCFEVSVWGTGQIAKQGLANNVGKMIIAPNYDLIKQSEYKGLYVIVNKNVKGDSEYGLVTEAGKVITEPKFESEASLYRYVNNKGLKLIKL